MRSASLAVALVAAGGLLFVAACTEDSPVSPVVDQATSVAPSDLASEGEVHSSWRGPPTFDLASRADLVALEEGRCLLENSHPDGKLIRRSVPLASGAKATGMNRLFQIRIVTVDQRLLFRVTCRTSAGSTGVDAMMERFVKIPLVSGSSSEVAVSPALDGDFVWFRPSPMLSCDYSEENPCEIDGVTGTADDPCPDDQYDPDDGWYYDSWEDSCECPPGWPCDDDWGSGGDDPPDDDGPGGGGGGSGDSDNPDCDAESLEDCEPDCELDPLAEGCEEPVYECPASYNVISSNPLTLRYLESVESELRFWYFDTWGTMHKVQDTPTGFGPPQAWYSIPQGPWSADLARSHGPGTLWAAEVHVACFYEVDEFGNITSEYFVTQDERNLDFQIGEL